MLKRGLPHYHPGRMLKNELVVAQGLTISEIASALGVSRTTISGIMNQKTAITPEMAVRLSTVFGGSAEIWASLQADYDIEQAAKKVKALKLKPFHYKKSA